MHSEIEKAIDLIEHKIEELQRAKRTLLELFGEKNVSIGKIQPSIPGLLKDKRAPRRETIINLLRSEGGLRRSEILEKTNIPLGTIATTLNDKGTFKNKDGKWYLLEKIEQDPFAKKEEESK